MRVTSAAETRNVTALTAYGTDGPQAAYISAPSERADRHASVSTVTVSELAFASSSSGTRFGIAAFAAGKKKPVATPVTPASTTSAVRAVDERQRREHAEAHEIGRDHQPTAREPVDERAEQEADDDDRQEVRDEEGGDPDARFRQIAGSAGRARSRRDRCRSSTPPSPGRGTRTTAIGEGGRDGWCSPRLVMTLPPFSIPTTAVRAVSSRTCAEAFACGEADGCLHGRSATHRRMRHLRLRRGADQSRLVREVLTQPALGFGERRSPLRSA